MAIEKLLKRDMNFKITLNQRSVISNIQFSASKEEIHSIKKDLRYKIYDEGDGSFFLFNAPKSPDMILSGWG